MVERVNDNNGGRLEDWMIGRFEETRCPMDGCFIDFESSSE